MTDDRSGGPGRAWRLASSPASVRDARRAAEQFMDVVAPGTDREVVVLLVSELVTNAVLHGGPDPIDLRLALEAGRLHIEVLDHNPGSPRLRAPEPDDESGRGLVLVDRAAREWGTLQIGGDGKCVWCDVDLSAARPSSPGAQPPRRA